MQRRCSSIVGLIVATRKGESPGNLAIFGVENLWIVEGYMIDIYIYGKGKFELLSLRDF